MSRKILLHKATRIEGNADIHVEVEAGRIQAARFMVQDFRGFEKFMQGKLAESAPHVVSRICGLCCTAHQVAGFKAVEDALGVELPSSVQVLREIAVLGEWIASHALSYFILAYPDAVEAQKGIFDLMSQHPRVAQDGLQLRKLGNRIVELIGKRAVHPVAMGVGRFHYTPTQRELEEIRLIAMEVKELTRRLIGEVAHKLDNKEKLIPFPSGHRVNFLAYDERPGHERFKAYERSGKVTEEFTRETFEDHISEMRVDWSFAKFPYLTELGFPEGILLVGPLSRLFREGGILEDAELKDFALTEQLRDPASRSLDDFDSCRLLEIHWAATQILNRLEDVDLSRTDPPDFDLMGSGAGIGVVEAPRGVLVHSYLINRGTVERMSLLVATQFNNAYINLVLNDLAQSHAVEDGLSETGESLLGRCVRVFDPCLTCATH